jgi:predicted dehydrogenase
MVYCQEGKTMRKVQVGFIGAGSFISTYHLLTAHDSRIMDVRAVADLDEEKLESHSSRMQIGYTTTDYKKVLSDPGIDMIIIGTKQDLHARLIIESLDAGKWSFCEKPMTQTKEESSAVLSAEKRNPGKLGIGFNRRFAPAYSEIKRLMQPVKRPWYINYRLMYPNPEKLKGFYADQERILFEGSHILDLVCWLLGSAPRRVFMTGDKLRDNCCILDYPDGSQVSFMCGSMGSFSLWKEYIEVFAYYKAITVSDFTDMRIRGFEGQFDRTFPPHGSRHSAEVMKHGFDFYETYKVKRLEGQKNQLYDDFGMFVEQVKRPSDRNCYNINIDEYIRKNPDSSAFNPDKGWVASLEQFARCFLNGTDPQNADGRAGALSTNLALALLESLETGQAVDFQE